MIHSIMSLILAHPFGMKTSHWTAPIFHISWLLLSPAQTAEDKMIVNIKSVIYTLPYHPAFAPSEHISLELQRYQPGSVPAFN